LLGAKVFATAGTDEKCAACVKAGAEAINYKTEDYVERIKALTGGKGVDVIMDMVGGDYFGRNLECLAKDGRLTIIALLKGAQSSASVSPILLKHLTVTGSTLRSRPLAEKAQMAKEIKKTLWPKLEKGELKPVIDQIFPLKDSEKALIRMQEGLNVGKILIKV
jgi:NADPH2:quinone reductase